MNMNGRAKGIVETHKRSHPIAPWATNAPALDVDACQKKWVIWQNTVSCIGEMYSSDYEKWVHSHCSTASQAAAILGKIDTWDTYARWFCVLELLYRHKIRLYDSREEAEQARRAAA